MSESPLDLNPLARAIARLAEGLTLLGRDPTNTMLRDAVIQRFEFTYEISHKMLKRMLIKRTANPPAIDDLSFADLIRTGNSHGLLAGTWPDWRHYRDMRAKSSHTYDEAIALEVLADIPAFLVEAQALLSRLQAHNT